MNANICGVTSLATSNCRLIYESHRKRRRYVADLANLELTADERARMVRDLNSILGHVDSSTSWIPDVPPMAQVSDRYGVDESKKGSERFAYASREDF